MKVRYSHAILTGLLLWMEHSAVWAQTAADKAAADTLFNEGKRLIAAGNIKDACAKFEASLAKATQLGAQLALASCYEKLGKTASAWGAFRAAASTASKTRDHERQKYADQHAAEVEKQLSRLVIKLERGYRIDGIQIKRNGIEVLRAELGSPVPVDPGEHVIDATSPGWSPWSTTVSVTSPGTIEVIVPVLGKPPEKVEEPEPQPPVVTSPFEFERRRRARRKLANTINMGGGVLVGVSLYLGSAASSSWSDAQAHCHDNLCDQTGFDLATRARTLGNLSTGVFVVGTAVLVVGVYLYLTAPSATEVPTTANRTTLRMVPEVGPAQLGLTIQGGF